MNIKEQIAKAKEAAIQKAQIALDPTVIDDRYFSPALDCMPPSADPYVLQKYREYTDQQRDTIIKAIASRIAGGVSKVKACSEPFQGIKMDYTTLKFWMRQVPTYNLWITEAEDDRYEALFDEIVDIPDELKDDADFVEFKDKVSLAKLRVNARMHLTAKARPEKFGTRTENKNSLDINISWNEKKTYKTEELDTEEVEYEDVESEQPENEE